MQFVHLHLHSEYSVLDGMGKLKDYVAKAIENDMPAMAITDHGNMFGVKEFFKVVKKAEKETGKKLKPIIGCEVYFNPEGRFAKRGKENQGANHLILLAKNLEGYYNLVKIVSVGWTEGYYYKPKIDREILEKYHENLICCSACLAGEVPQLILKENYAKAEETALWFKNLFGEDYYFEIQNHKTEIAGLSQEVFEAQQKVNESLYRLGAKLGIKCVATNDCHFVNKEDGPVHDHLICLTTNELVTNEKRLHYTQQEYMKTAEEMAEINPGHPEVISNTLEVAEKVERYSIDRDHVLPIFPLPEGFTDSNDYLRHLVYEGAKMRYKDPAFIEKHNVYERIDFELNTIKSMGFPDYFLIVQDYIKAARERDIWVGPGRGSAAGSVVAYCLTITNMDPIKYDLLFERFLNPDRISMPDIDVDFEEEKRSKVLDYVEEKYGKDHVAHVVTFGTMATKSAIKDVARVKNLPLNISNALAKMVPAKFPDETVKEVNKEGVEEEKTKSVPVNFKNCLRLVPEFRHEYEESSDPLVRETLHYAEELEGTVRNTGVHACAVIIGRDNLANFIPLSIAKDKETGNAITVSQYEGSHIEEVGMLKMDFLGLKTLSILKEALRNIKAHRGIDIDIEAIPIDDEETFRLFGRGDTIATFQFESPGMQKNLRELKPTRFEDLIAMNALYRPGPIQYIPSFIARKNGREKITYDIPEMEEILSETYGVTVYQEQVMRLSQKLAGFTKGQADGLRKAMGKKLIDKMMEMEELFIKGGVERGHDKETLSKIWKDWKEFAKYAFNKSHSTCYAWVGYQTAYLKAHYPAEFMASNLTKNLGNIEEITKFMDECKRMGITVLGPDVNASGINFTVTGDREIRFGLAAIKGMGSAIAKDIIDSAPYSSIFDFVERAGKVHASGGNSLNRKALESLAYAGAFDSAFPEIRRDQYFLPNAKGETFIDLLVRFLQNLGERKDECASLFGDSDEGFKVRTPDIPPIVGEYNTLSFLNKEKELVGMYISSHPLDAYRFELENFGTANLSVVKEKVEKNEESETNMLVGGLITDISKRISQKSGRPFATITFEDFHTSMNFTLFGKDYEKFLSYLEVGNALFLKIEMKLRYASQKNVEPKIVRMALLANVKENFLESFTIDVPSAKITPEFRKEFVALLKENKGEANTPVVLKITDVEKGFSLTYNTKFKVEITKDFLSMLEKYGLRYEGKFNTSLI